MRGERQVLANLDRATDGFVRAAELGLYQLGVEIMRQAQRLVPRVTGRLARSAYVAAAKGDNVELGYAEDYAPEVHEGTGRGRKWLQAAVMAYTGPLGLKIVADVVEAAGKRKFRGVGQPTSEFRSRPS